jgi:hypothetical protein
MLPVRDNLDSVADAVRELNASDGRTLYARLELWLPVQPKGEDVCASHALPVC